MIKPSRSKGNCDAVKALKKTIAGIKGTRERKAKQVDDPFAYRPGMGSDFYKTREWRELRWKVLKESDGKCKKCRRPYGDGPIHIDHILPRSKFPHLELVRSNLQDLCEDCNLGKSDSL